ncbi:hypothetical protein JRE03_003898 [Salmonella enterica]|nr:hypothetical protein [Salmonella enterica]
MDESRKQFEIMAAKELRILPEMVEKDRTGKGYNYNPLNLWWKIWKASRDAIKIKLDDKVMVEDEFDKGHNCAIDYCADAIRAAGIKVKE